MKCTTPFAKQVQALHPNIKRQLAHAARELICCRDNHPNAHESVVNDYWYRLPYSEQIKDKGRYEYFIRGFQKQMMDVADRKIEKYMELE